MLLLAARAGESGKGFAVVANEVKELSKTTKSANEDIQSTLTTIASSIQELSSSLSETKSAIENSLDNVSSSKQSISTITNQTSEFGAVIQQNINDFQTLATHTYNMNTQVTELSTIGETFTNLLEMMNVHGLFEGAGNPIDRLVPLVKESDFSDPSRFAKFEEEIALKANDVLISATDASGCITFANTKFYELAEYAVGELMGKPHNVIRHPDMPKTAFTDLWKVVESGHLWQGIVKNRTKLGKYYWVKAMVFPCYKNSQIVGFISVRKCPTKEEIQDAIEAYKKLP
jgi:aerotaxis receptor